MSDGEVKAVHTLNARGNIMLEVIRQHFQLSPERMFREIQAMRGMIETALASKGISYESLKSALVPDRKRREIALVFDTSATKNTWYGREIFEKVIPLFDRNSNHSVLVGDYIDTGAGQPLLLQALNDAITLNREVDYEHSSQFFIVYINNLSDRMVKNFNDELLQFRPYIGLADTTYASVFKLLLSTMLADGLIKHGNVIIQGHEPDRPDSDDVNMSGYPFEENGYVCRSVNGDLQGILLSYKIERPVFDGFETDTEFSLNAIGIAPSSLNEFSIQVDDAKLAYIKSAKAGSIERAGLEVTTSAELAEIIRSKIADSYIYNMAFDTTYNVAKFNVIIELPTRDGVARTRLLASLEYQAEKKVLRLITLY